MPLCCVLLLLAPFLPASFCLHIIQVPNITVYERQPTTLRCDFNSNSERAVSAKFYHLPDDRNPLKNTSDGRIMLHTDSGLIMSISSTLLCDAGVYVCVAELIRGNPYNGPGTELIVLENPDLYGSRAIPSYELQPVVDVIRVILLIILIILLVIIICKFW